MLGKLGLISLSAVLYAAAFPPASVRVLVWVALVPLFAALLACRSSWRAMLVGAAWALLMTFLVGRCLPPAVVLFHQQSAAAGWGLLALAGILTAVPHYAVAAFLIHRLAERETATWPVLVGASWAVTEWARVALPPGNPWAIAGLATIDLPDLVGLARLTGVYGLSFLVAAVNAAVLVLLRRGVPWRAKWQGVLVTAGMLLVAVYLSAATRPPALRGEEAPVVALVQPALPPDTALSSADHRRRLHAHLELTKEALRYQPDIVVWPESSLGFFLEEDGAWRSDLRLRAALEGTELIAGGPRLRADESVANSMFVLGERGWPVGIYDKQVLLPLGEWFPASTEGILRRDPGAAPRSYAVGEHNEVLLTSAAPMGAAICNEIMVPGILRTHVFNGARVLLNPANDAWFPHPGCPMGLFDIARMRAVEFGRPLIRISSSGPSAVIDPSGAAVAHIPAGESGFRLAPVAPLRTSTPYTRFGDVFAGLCALLVGGTLARQSRTAR